MILQLIFLYYGLINYQISMVYAQQQGGRNQQNPYFEQTNVTDSLQVGCLVQHNTDGTQINKFASVDNADPNKKCVDQTVEPPRGVQEPKRPGTSDPRLYEHPRQGQQLPRPLPTQDSQRTPPNSGYNNNQQVNPQVRPVTQLHNQQVQPKPYSQPNLQQPTFNKQQNPTQPRPYTQQNPPQPRDNNQNVPPHSGFNEQQIPSQSKQINQQVPPHPGYTNQQVPAHPKPILLQPVYNNPTQPIQNNQQVPPQPRHNNQQVPIQSTANNQQHRPQHVYGKNQQNPYFEQSNVNDSLLIACLVQHNTGGTQINKFTSTDNVNPNKPCVTQPPRAEQVPPRNTNQQLPPRDGSDNQPPKHQTGYNQQRPPPIKINQPPVNIHQINVHNSQRRAGFNTQTVKLVQTGGERKVLHAIFVQNNADGKQQNVFIHNQRNKTGTVVISNGKVDGHTTEKVITIQALEFDHTAGPKPKNNQQNGVFIQRDGDRNVQSVKWVQN